MVVMSTPPKIDGQIPKSNVELKYIDPLIRIKKGSINRNSDLKIKKMAFQIKAYRLLCS